MARNKQPMDLIRTLTKLVSIEVNASMEGHFDEVVYEMLCGLREKNFFPEKLNYTGVIQTPSGYRVEYERPVSASRGWMYLRLVVELDADAASELGPVIKQVGMIISKGESLVIFERWLELKPKPLVGRSRHIMNQFQIQLNGVAWNFQSNFAPEIQSLA